MISRVRCAASVSVLFLAAIPLVAQAVSQQTADLIASAIAGDVDQLQHLLAGGAEVNQPDESGMTPLLYASRSAAGNVIRLLISAGAQVNTESPSGVTPLLAAVSGHNIEATAALLEADADPNKANRDGVSALALARRIGDEALLKTLYTALGVEGSLESAPVLLFADRDCQVLIDGGEVHDLVAQQAKKVTLPFGQHLVEAASFSTSKNWQGVLEIDDPRQQVLVIEFAAIQQEGLEYVLTGSWNSKLRSVGFDKGSKERFQKELTADLMIGPGPFGSSQLFVRETLTYPAKNRSEVTERRAVLRFDISGSVLNADIASAGKKLPGKDWKALKSARILSVNLESGLLAIEVEWEKKNVFQLQLRKQSTVQLKLP